MLLKSHVISGRAAEPISSPYYSNLSEGEKSNIPRPGTLDTSSQDPGCQAASQSVTQPAGLQLAIPFDVDYSVDYFFQRVD